MSSVLLKVVKMSIQVMSLEPSDIALERHMSDGVVKQIFEDFFADKNEKIHQAILNVNPLYVRAKGLLMKLSNDRQLTQSKKNILHTLLEEQSDIEWTFNPPTPPPPIQPALIDSSLYVMLSITKFVWYRE